MNPIDARAFHNCEFRHAGPDGILGNSDDSIYGVAPHYEAGANLVVIDVDVPGGVLPAGPYRLTIRGDSSRDPDSS